MYVNSHFSITMGSLVFLYAFSKNSSFYFIRNMFMVLMFTLALVGYYLYPAAPPRFYAEWGFHDSVAEFTGIDHTTP